MRIQAISVLSSSMHKLCGAVSLHKATRECMQVSAAVSSTSHFLLRPRLGRCTLRRAHFGRPEVCALAFRSVGGYQ